MTGTGKFAADLRELQGKQWSLPSRPEEPVEVRVFAAGDYALLSLWYGLSGPSGKRPCLWCETAKESMTLEPDDRELILRKRTLERLDMHYRLFQEEGGGNISKAKLYKNVIAPYMFNVPLDQVCVPGLHVSLGIYHRLYTMMEAELQDLDRVIGAYMVRVVDDEDMDEGEVLYHHQLHGLKPYVEAMQEARAVDNMVEDLSEELEELESSLAYAILQARSLDNIMSMKEEIERLMERKRKLESESEDIKNRHQITSTNGPLSSLLDTVLQNNNARRQAYHGGGFVGNHVEVMLKEQAIEDLTSAAKQAAEEIVTQFEAFPLDLVTRSNDIRVKYETIFKAFAKCHKGYSHTNSMTNEEISNLDCSIKHFLAKYRELFPTSSVSVKMHLLEEHVIPWIRCWGVGLGFHGEQGVEQVHAVFNRINRSTSSIPDAVRRLKSTLETHLLQVHPGRQDGVPAPKKRRRNCLLGLLDLPDKMVQWGPLDLPEKKEPLDQLGSLDLQEKQGP
ncbi:uncharacterized protein LOC144916526 [Branchiostoma floridae x Branchiostoma belcheri]